MATLANAGGSRRAVDLLAEVSYHLVEQVLDAAIVSIGGAGGYGKGPYGLVPYGGGSGPVTVVLNVPVEFYLYPGAQIVIGYQLPDEELVTVLSVNQAANSFTCVIVNSHSPGDPVFGATFPTQQTTDPLYTQPEMLDYLAHAQNDFLNKVPLILDLFGGNLISVGQQYYLLPPTAIELERVAVQNGLADAEPIATVQRAGGVVTAILTLPSDFTPALPVLVLGVNDPGNNPSFNSISDYYTYPVATVSTDGLTLTWPQAGANFGPVAGNGAVVGAPTLTRLYESAQEQLSMQNPAWQTSLGSQVPTNWYEDRSGVYGWGVAPIPTSNFWAELLCSVRDTVALGMLDSFLLPDCFAVYLNYYVLACAWGKSGEQSSPTMAKFAQQRFDYGVMLADRFLRSVVNNAGGQR